VKRLIIVDDNTSVTLVLSRIFAVKFPSIEVVCFNTKAAGISALNWMQHNEPDYAILDLVINGVNGNDLYEFLREKQYNTKTVFLTGCSDSDTKLQKFVKKYPHLPVLRKVASVDSILTALQLHE
jgi:ActR/RegA family two-component response regulator